MEDDVHAALERLLAKSPCLSAQCGADLIWPGGVDLRTYDHYDAIGMWGSCSVGS
jgi:hypothetical protein